MSVGPAYAPSTITRDGSRSTPLRPGPPYAVAGRVAKVRNKVGHIYREASVTEHAPLLTVPMETRSRVWPVAYWSDSWTAVKLPDGRAAWVQLGDVVFDPPS